ncbi:MAG: nucleotide exchange factor GrpE [Deferribacteres bacterium]|nr:nucleotide exchange factor GrpE [candidate division KSB1 bacterium]MCB9511903.1 nucleotide exchange factor GrpE [Deferribacteres bacterium]
MAKEDKNKDTADKEAVAEEAAKEKVNGKVEQTDEASQQAEKSDNGKQKSAKSKEKKETEKFKNELEQLRDQYLRNVADFDNYRKRKERELTEAWGLASAEFAKKILPALDDLDRTVESAKSDKDFDALVQGLELIYKAFSKVLEEEGIEAIDAVGQEFNPEFHDALLQMEKDGVESNIVIDQSQKGYKMGDRILRPAKVIVSK